MKKKNIYIRPEVEIFQVETTSLLKDSEINDKPYGAKPYQDSFSEDDWDDDVKDDWQRVGYQSDFPKQKSLWDE